MSDDKVVFTFKGALALASMMPSKDFVSEVNYNPKMVELKKCFTGDDKIIRDIYTPHIRIVLMGPPGAGMPQLALHSQTLFSSVLCSYCCYRRDYRVPEKKSSVILTLIVFYRQGNSGSSSQQVLPSLPSGIYSNFICSIFSCDFSLIAAILLSRLVIFFARTSRKAPSLEYRPRRSWTRVDLSLTISWSTSLKMSSRTISLARTGWLP